jgi:hypothetical protein
MNGALLFGYVLCAVLIGVLLKGRLRLYYFMCGVFAIGLIAAGSGMLDGVRGNHWESRGRKGGTSWYQEIGVGLVLMGAAVYFARLDWTKKREPNPPPVKNARDVT